MIEPPFGCWSLMVLYLDKFLMDLTWFLRHS